MMTEQQQEQEQQHSDSYQPNKTWKGQKRNKNDSERRLYKTTKCDINSEI